MDLIKGHAPEMSVLFFGVLITFCDPLPPTWASERLFSNSKLPALPAVNNQAPKSIFAASQRDGSLALKYETPVQDERFRIAGAKGDLLTSPKPSKLIITPTAQSSEDTLLEDDDTAAAQDNVDQPDDELLDSDTAKTDPDSEDALLNGDDKVDASGNPDQSGDELLDSGVASLGFGFQLQQAVGQHVQLQFEAFYTINEGRKDSSGVRSEILFVL